MMLVPITETIGTPTIWLVSAEETLTAVFTAVFPAVDYRYLPSLDQLEPALKDSPAPPSLLIFEPNCDAPPPRGNWPRIALIRHPDQRQYVANHKLDDYLLWPLLPSEIYQRLRAYLPPLIPTCAFLVDGMTQLKEGAPPMQVMETVLHHLRAQAQTTAVGYVAWQADQKRYSPPPHLNGNDLNDNEPLLADLARWETSEQAPRLAHFPNTLILPLHDEQTPLGLLTLGYDHPLEHLDQHDWHAIHQLQHKLSLLTSLAKAQEEAQAYATQTALLVLVARMLSELSDLDSILSLTLEHALSLSGGVSGVLWLIDKSGGYLEPVSAATTPSLPLNPIRAYPLNQGLLGWVVQHDQLLFAPVPDAHPAFLPKLDGQTWSPGYALAAVPLRQQNTVGVLVLYTPITRPFNQQDLALLESMSGLVAAAIMSARLLRELRDHNEQQHVLYEMGQKIGSGLDLPTAQTQALLWATRLCSVETGFLWLLDETQEALTLVATHGVPHPTDADPIAIQLQDTSLVGWVIEHAQPVLVEDVEQDERFNPKLNRLLDFKVHNFMAVPLIYRQQPLGVLSLVNKVGTSFSLDDLTLMSTAVEMIAIAIGNAHLYAQTLALMDERERLHQHTVRSARLATIGRLTASFAHEINNPMQAIRASMKLALEELDDPEAVTDYLTLTLEQSERVVNLVSRMRQIYRPEESQQGTFDLNQLIREVVQVANKEFKRQQVQVRLNTLPEPCLVEGVPNQLHLVFLNLLLNVAEALGEQGGGTLSIELTLAANMVGVAVTTAVAAVPTQFQLKTHAQQSPEEAEFSFEFSQEILASHGGQLRVHRHNEQATVQVTLPRLSD